MVFKTLMFAAENAQIHLRKDPRSRKTKTEIHPTPPCFFHEIPLVAPPAHHPRCATPRPTGFDEARGRRDGREPGNGAHTETHQGGTTQTDPFDPQGMEKNVNMSFD